MTVPFDPVTQVIGQPYRVLTGWGLAQAYGDTEPLGLILFIDLEQMFQ